MIVLIAARNKKGDLGATRPNALHDGTANEPVDTKAGRIGSSMSALNIGNATNLMGNENVGMAHKTSKNTLQLFEPKVTVNLRKCKGIAYTKGENKMQDTHPDKGNNLSAIRIPVKASKDDPKME